MGLESADIVLDSRKIAGATSRHFSNKRLLSQAPVLSLEDGQELERICNQSSCNMDRYMSGALLVCIYGRCRWSDVANLHACDLLDPSFLELTTVVHKTSVTAVRTNTLLPIAVPTVGLTDNYWFDSWVEVAGILDRKSFGPLMSNDTFLERPLTSTEVSSWLTGLQYVRHKG